MVHTITINYNNRPAQTAVNLKNKRGEWLKAKELSLPSAITPLQVKRKWTYRRRLRAPIEVWKKPVRETLLQAGADGKWGGS